MREAELRAAGEEEGEAAEVEEEEGEQDAVDGDAWVHADLAVAVAGEGHEEPACEDGDGQEEGGHEGDDGDAPVAEAGGAPGDLEGKTAGVVGEDGLARYATV